MTLDELQIQLDVSSGNEIEVLKQHTCNISNGYLFVDSSNGHCYLYDIYGKLDDISKVKSIGKWAFESCISLKSIIIPDSVKSIGDSAFIDCISLESIVIPDSVKCIGEWAFAGCTSLKSIIISNSAKKIGDWAFGYCTSLKEVIFKGKTIDQVNAMDNYPWGIEDISIIKCQMS